MSGSDQGSRLRARTRVCVVGGGAAGMAVAWSLSRSDRFEVELWEKEARVGGVATSEEFQIPDGKGWLRNDDHYAMANYHCLIIVSF